MATKLVYRSDNGVALLAGLDWRLLPVEGKQDAQLREIGKDRGATHAAVCQSTHTEEVKQRGKVRQVSRASAGYYSSVDGTKLPKGTHSVAAAFATWARDHENALLCVQTDENTIAVVIVSNGLPVTDRLEKTWQSAFEQVKPWLQDHPGASIFSDNQALFPGSLQSEDLLRSVSKATSRATLIRPIPVDTVRLVVLASAVLVAIGGYHYYTSWKAEKARQEALARQRAADPVPKYLAALTPARSNMGTSRESLLAALDRADKILLVPTGWATRRIECSAAGGCLAIFARTTGTYEDLTKALPELTLDRTYSPNINLNEARMVWTQEMKPSGMPPGQPATLLTDFLKGDSASLLQDWLVAGLSIQVAPPQLWPQVPGVPSTFKHPQAMGAGRFELNGVALPQLREAIGKAPSNVFWQGWAIDVGDAKQAPLERARARITGTYYVRYN